MIVRCSTCNQDVSSHQAREQVTVWVAVGGKGGTMSNVREPKRTGVFRCFGCQREREATKAQGSLL